MEVSSFFAKWLSRVCRCEVDCFVDYSPVFLHWSIPGIFQYSLVQTFTLTTEFEFIQLIDLSLTLACNLHLLIYIFLQNVLVLHY